MKKHLLTSIAIPLLLIALLVGGLSTGAGKPEAVHASPLFPGDYTEVYSTFLILHDTPGSYSGEAGHIPVVNAGETALSFASGLYWDDANDRLGLKTTTPEADLEVNAGTEFGYMYFGGARKTTGQGIGGMYFIGNDSADNKTEYAGIAATIVDPTNGSEDGKVTLATMRAGTLTAAVTVLNDGTVGINDPTPSYPLDVAGTVRAQEDLRANYDVIAGGTVQGVNVTATGNAYAAGDVEAESQLFQGRASSANDPSNMLLGLDNPAGGAMLWAHDNLWYAETIFDDEDAIGPRHVLYVRWIAYNKTHSDYQQGTAILTPGDHVTLYQRAGPPRVDLSLYFGIYEDYEVMVLQPVLPEDYFRVVIWAMWLSD